MNCKATLIYLEDNLILSKKVYKNWREIQQEYNGKFKASLSPMTCEEILDFFRVDFIDEDTWPFSKSSLISFFESEHELTLDHNTVIP